MNQNSEKKMFWSDKFWQQNYAKDFCDTCKYDMKKNIENYTLEAYHSKKGILQCENCYLKQFKDRENNEPIH